MFRSICYESLLVLCILNMCLLCIIKSVRVLSSSEKHQTDLLLHKKRNYNESRNKRVNGSFAIKQKLKLKFGQPLLCQFCLTLTRDALWLQMCMQCKCVSEIINAIIFRFSQCMQTINTNVYS